MIAASPRRGLPDAYSVLIAKAADGIREVGAFSDPEQWRFEWKRAYTREERLVQVSAFGGHSRLPPATLER